MTEERLQDKLDRVLSLLAVVTARQGEMSDEIHELRENIAAMGVKVDETKEVVEAWTAAKASMRFAKWAAGFVAAAAGAWAVVKGLIWR